MKIYINIAFFVFLISIFIGIGIAYKVDNKNKQIKYEKTN